MKNIFSTLLVFGVVFLAILLGAFLLEKTDILYKIDSVDKEIENDIGMSK